MTKHIGIVDVSTVGATICQLAIAQGNGASYGDHPEFSVNSLPFKRYHAAFKKKDWRGVAAIILESITNLKKAGADFAIIPANTPHFAFNMIEKKSPVPLLNLVSIATEECAKKRV